MAAAPGLHDRLRNATSAAHRRLEADLGLATPTVSRASGPAGAGSALEEFPPPDPPQGIVWNFRNLSYAAQWWVFGLAAIVFWVSLMRRELDDHRKARQDGGAAAEGPAEPAQPSAEMVAD